MEEKVLTFAFAVFLVFGAFIAILVLAVGGTGEVESPIVRAEATPLKPVSIQPTSWTREEFRKQALGLSRREVLEHFGRPRHTTPEGHSRREVWYYANLPVFDPLSNQRDTWIGLYFDFGEDRLVEIHF